MAEELKANRFDTHATSSFLVRDLCSQNRLAMMSTVILLVAWSHRWVFFNAHPEPACGMSSLASDLAKRDEAESSLV